MSLLTRLRKLVRLKKPTPRVKLIPWKSSHSGSFDDDEEAYTLVVDGDVTNISFAIETGDAKAPDFTKVDMKIPHYIAYYGVSIEDSITDEDIRPEASHKGERDL